MRSTRAALGRDAGRGDEAATRGPDGIHGCDPRPSARIVGGDVRYWTGVRGPTPHKVLRAHERRIQGDGSRLPWGPLAAGHPNWRRPPSPPDAQTHGARTSRWTSAGSHYWWAKNPADPPIRGAPTMTPLRTSSTATPPGRASKDATKPILEPPTPRKRPPPPRGEGRPGPGRVTKTPDGARRRVQG